MRESSRIFLMEQEKGSGINKLSQNFSFGLPEVVQKYDERRSLLIARKIVSCVLETFNIPFYKSNFKSSFFIQPIFLATNPSTQQITAGITM